MKTSVLLVAALLCGCGEPASAPQAFAEFRGDPDVARAAVRTWAQRGPAAIEELKTGLSDDSMKVQARAREALSMITGQWGGDGRLMWQRSVDDAKGGDKPLMVLHLFGNFDEEFC